MTQTRHSVLNAQQVQHWLTLLHSDGVQPRLPELLRYQAKTRLLPLSATSPKALRAGNRLAKAKGRGMEFAEVRHYQPGDDVRAIDWKVTARTSQVHTKLYQEERERPVLLLCDLSSAMRFGSQLLFKSVQACHLTALFAWAAAEQGDRVGALLFADETHLEIKPRSRTQGVLAILAACQKLHLAQPDALNDLRLQKALQRALYLAKPGTKVVLVSDLTGYNAACHSLLGRLAQHCDVEIAQILDPMELSLPAANQQLTVRHGQQHSRLNLADPSLLSRYQQHQQAWLAGLASDLSKLGCRYHQISAAQALEQQLRPAS